MTRPIHTDTDTLKTVIRELGPRFGIGDYGATDFGDAVIARLQSLQPLPTGSPDCGADAMERALTKGHSR